MSICPSLHIYIYILPVIDHLCFSIYNHGDEGIEIRMKFSPNTFLITLLFFQQAILKSLKSFKKEIVASAANHKGGALLLESLST
jgi:hypothetical protein